MDPVTLTFYAAVCGLLSAFAPDKAGRVPRFAIGVAVGMGVEPTSAIEAIASYRGVSRRFEVQGEVGGATVVDDYGEPITVHAFAVIGKELEQLYAQLEARDLAAGSAAARRLFS